MASMPLGTRPTAPSPDSNNQRRRGRSIAIDQAPGAQGRNSMVIAEPPPPAAKRHRRALALSSALSALALFGISGAAQAAAPNFIEFESGQVRPLAISPDGS